MKRQLVTSMGSLSIVIAAALLAPASAAEQPGAVPRLADGHPDLQGVWDYRTITPMQRPLELGTKEFFASDEEAAAWEQTENRRQNRDAERTGAVPPGWPGAPGLRVCRNVQGSEPSTHRSKKCRERLLFGVIYFYQTFKTTSLENIPYGPFGVANLELATFSL